MSNITGDPDGIKLWNLLSSSNDKIERDYVEQIRKVASKHGTVWFTDIVAQKKEKRNQTTWQMSWNKGQAKWVISLFYIPEGVQKIADRTPVSDGIDIDIENCGFEENQWSNINVDDIFS